MAGGILQLVSKGNEDIYLTNDPSITFFKMLYKRHTNFSMESVVQNFNSIPNFGNKVTCTVGRTADLIGQIYIVVTLPQINYFQESSSLPNLNQCAWIKNVGWSIINSVEIEIGGYIIDKHYGDWLSIWSELCEANNTDKSRNIMIGNVPELTNFSNSKKSYTLYIPLYFWFCKDPGLALPIIALEFSDVKINIEFANINNLLILAPTNYIEINDDTVHFKTGDILYQQINNTINYIQFMSFQYINTGSKRLYYNKISSSPILGPINSILLNNYKINSMNNIYSVSPKINASEKLWINKQQNFSWQNNLSISSAYLLVDYIYLDIDERIKFIKSNHEYLIDILLFDNDHIITNNSTKVKLGYSHPCKEIIFRAQMTYLTANNLLQNYNYSLDYFNTKPIITNVQIIMNGQNRLSPRSSEYFNLIQPFQHHVKPLQNGVYCYSFSLFPDNHQPSGSCNLSKIDDFQVNITTDKQINYSNQANFRVYARCINILRIINGCGGLAFSN